MLNESTQYRTQTFKLPKLDVSVTVRERIGMDAFDLLSVRASISYLTLSKRVQKRADYFIEAVLRSEVTGDVGFEWPSPDSEDAVIQVAFSKWQTDLGFMTVTWANALDNVNKALDNPNSTPPKDGGS